MGTEQHIQEQRSLTRRCWSCSHIPSLHHCSTAPPHLLLFPLDGQRCSYQPTREPAGESALSESRAHLLHHRDGIRARGEGTQEHRGCPELPTLQTNLQGSAHNTQQDSTLLLLAKACFLPDFKGSSLFFPCQFQFLCITILANTADILFFTFSSLLPSSSLLSSLVQSAFSL